MAKLKLGVHISGRGSNLQALIEACKAPGFPAEIVLAISNVEGVGGLDHAKAAGIPTLIIPHKNYPDRKSFEEALDAAHRKAGVELICNAGFMRILSPYLVQRWAGRMINIHPSLLPAFPGIHTHEKVIAAGVKFSGCTVHFMNEGTDEGAIIVQAAVPVLPGDDAGTLAARVLAFEHKAYPLAVRLIAEGRVRLEGGKCVWRDAESPKEAGILNPPAK